VSRWTVVLAGGVGSRFWPLSTPERPKQLLPLIEDAPMLTATLRRLRSVAPPERTLVLTNASLKSAVSAVARDLPKENVIAEPAPAGTAAALTWAAAEIARRAGDNAVMISVHADWAIGDETGFRKALRRAADAAEKHQSLVTVGVVPVRPDVGFGYIQVGAQVSPGVNRVERFVEKPDLRNAERMQREGYLWNSGIFVWRVGDFLADVAEHTPEVAPALRAARDDIARFFATVRPVSVDVGVLERSERVMVLRGDFGWDDVGTWASLARVRTRDADGNAVLGKHFLLESKDNVVHAEGNTVVLYGVNNLVVVTRDGLTFVTTLDKAADLKKLVEALPPSIATEKR
jgi:mannose-1-phosphate guanylyltransferase